MESLKSLKFFACCFGILFLVKCTDLYRDFFVDHKFSWFHSISAILFLIAFLDVVYSIKSKKYKTA